MRMLNKKILVVEDDPTYLSFWERFLKIIGYEMISAKSYEEVSPIIKDLDIDLCILDIVLPGKNGYELLDDILKLHPNIPSLITTAFGSKVARFDPGSRRFHLLHKPFTDLGKLQSLITNLAEGKNVFDEADDRSFSDNFDYPEVTEWSF